MRRSSTIGLALFCLGVVVVLFILARLVFPQSPAIPVLWFLAMLTGVGFAVLLVGLWGRARDRRRAIRADLAVSGVASRGVPAAGKVADGDTGRGPIAG